LHFLEKVLARVEVLFNWINRINLFLCCCALVVLILTFGWLVIGRYILNSTPTWVEQLALLLVVYITFLATASGVYENRHLGMAFLRDATPSFIRRPLVFVTHVAVATFGFIMMTNSVELFEFGWSTKLPMLNIPESFRTLPVIICGGMMFMFASAQALCELLNTTHKLIRKNTGE
tara:strand:- start:79 stop:606 length:528 start_codon:yes stop_codon:yes gene_type:complete